MLNFIFYFLYKPYISATPKYSYFNPFINNFGVRGLRSFEVTLKCFLKPIPTFNVTRGGRIGIRPIGVGHIPPAILPILSVNTKKRLGFFGNDSFDGGNVIGLGGGHGNGKTGEEDR